jgi:hypothetical protein
VTALAQLKGSSMHFVVGAPTDDRDQTLARRWVDGIVAAAGSAPAVTASDAGSHGALGLRLLTGRVQLPTSTTTTALALDATALAVTRRVPGHTLVVMAPRLTDALVMRGLPSSSSRLTLSTTGLAKFELQQTWFVQPRAGVTLDPRSDEGGLWLLLWVLRLGVQSIYLCDLDPAASGASVGGLARALRDLTQTTVYWNDHPLRFEHTTAAVSESGKVVVPTRTITKAFIGPPGGPPVSGTPFVGTTDVPLEAKPGEFLPGAQHQETR